MESILIEVLGWMGTLMILAAYVMVTRWGVSPGYQWLNLVGSAGLCVNTIFHQSWPGAALNVCWMAVAVVGLMTFRRRWDRTPF